MHPTLVRLCQLLDRHHIKHESASAWSIFGPKDLVMVPLARGTAEITAVDKDYVRFKGTIPVEGAAVAIAGPYKDLLDEFPERTEVINFGHRPMKMRTDGAHYMLTADQAKRLANDCKRLETKAQNQRRDLKRMHRKAMAQSTEILRMEQDALRMAILAEGYADGE